MPRLTLVAGPNGSVKSTLTAAIELDKVVGIVDPDAIAAALDPAQPSRAAFAAARQAVLRSRSLLTQRESFILESTLAGHGALSLMREAQKASYRTLLIYVALGDPRGIRRRAVVRQAILPTASMRPRPRGRGIGEYDSFADLVVVLQ